MTTHQQSTADQQSADKKANQIQQDHCQQLQRDLADAISRLAPLDDIRILLASGAKPNQPVTQGLHPIHYAVYQNFDAAVRLLILRGCDINAMDDNGYTPVHLVAERGYYQLLKFLIESNAKVCFCDVRKEAEGSQNSIVDEPLSLALKNGHLDCARLLLKNGANPNARYFRGSEINIVNILKVGAIKLLLEFGADPNSRDRKGLSPLMHAARHPLGYTTVKLLIDHGADVNDISYERDDYRTVLHYSIFSGNVDSIRLLLTNGARYPLIDFDKPSPLDIAIISGRPDIVKLLLEFDADVNRGAASIGLPLSIALTQNIRHKIEIIKILLDGGANPNAFIVSSVRISGPPLNDYLISLHHSFIEGRLEISEQQNDGARHNRMAQKELGEQIEIVRLLLLYGARVILVRSSICEPLGLLRTIERLENDMSLQLLANLIDNAERIDWPSVIKVIYNCLQLIGISRNQLNDPSNFDRLTADEFINILSVGCDYVESQDIKDLLQGLIEKFDEAKLISSGNSITCCQFVPNLKHIVRFNIKRHLISTNKVRGRQFVESLKQMQVPKTLKNYLISNGTDKDKLML